MKREKFILPCDFVGRIGDLLFYYRNQRRYVRHVKSGNKKKSVPTASQLLGQARIRYLVTFYRAIKDTMLRDVWRIAPHPEGMNGYNYFIRCNYAIFDEEGSIVDYARLRIAIGMSRLPQGIQVEMNAAREIVITWRTGLDDLLGVESDPLHVFMMYDDDTFRFQLCPNISSRGEGRACIRLQPWDDDPVHVYYFFGKADNSDFSESGYCRLGKARDAPL